MESSFKFIDLFCGIGGFHQAMEDLGGECVFASDIDADCRKTYKNNYGLEPVGDITKVNEADIPAHDVLCAGFPCQAFSVAGKRLGFEDETKGTLFFDVMRIMKYHKPKYALLENVRNLASHDNGKTWRVIRKSIKSIGYNIIEEPVIFSPHYIGIPQHRERVYIMCVRNDIGTVDSFVFNAENAPQCSIDTILSKDSEIENIERYRLSDDILQLIDIWQEFITNIKCEKLPSFPVCAEYLEPELDKSVFKDCYEWKVDVINKNRKLYEENSEFIDGWLGRARKCPAFFGAKARMEWQAGDTATPNIWDNIIQFRPSGMRVKVGTYFPALVAITQTSIVPRIKRKLTVRECCRLQSFPDSFIPDEREAQAYKQLGNSVNVEVTKLFAKFMFGYEDVKKMYSTPVLF